jgi:hypothetical protein
MDSYENDRRGFFTTYEIYSDMILLFVISQIIALLAASLDYLFNDKRTTIYKRTRVGLIIALIISLGWGTYKMNQEDDNNTNEKNLQNAKIKELKDSLFTLNQSVKYSGLNTLLALEKQKATLSERIDNEGDILIGELRNKAKATNLALDNLKKVSLEATDRVNNDVNSMKNLINFDDVKLRVIFRLDNKRLMALNEYKKLKGYQELSLIIDLIQNNSHVRFTIQENDKLNSFEDCTLRNTNELKGSICLSDSILSFNNYKLHIGGANGTSKGFQKNIPIKVEVITFIPTNFKYINMGNLQLESLFLTFNTGDYLWENKFTKSLERHTESFLGELKSTNR